MSLVFFWEKLIGNRADSFEGNNVTHIHNPTIRYFRQILAHSIFCRENNGKVNVKELFYTHSVFEPTRVNSDPFMMAHMQEVCTAKRYHISIGGVITSIACAIGLEAELAILEPLPTHSLDILAC